MLPLQPVICIDVPEYVRPTNIPNHKKREKQYSNNVNNYYKMLCERQPFVIPSMRHYRQDVRMAATNRN